MNVTMEEVARRAGVSKTTVSRIINGIPNSASPSTIQRVTKVIEQLGYVPNTLAASLKSFETKTVGIIVGDIENPFFGVVIKGIANTLRDAGYYVILADSGYSFKNERELALVFIERQIDAIILAPSGPSPSKSLEKAHERGIPIVLIDNNYADFDVDFVGVDNFNASYQASRYLIELGHKDLAIITGLQQRFSSSERSNGFLSALEDCHIQLNPLYFKESDYSVEGGYNRTKELIQLDKPPTAIFISNNFMTVGALRAFHEAGVQIPDDISIIGFDDMYWYTITNPPLTAIDQPAYDLGKVAAERVLLRLRGNQEIPPERIELATQLKIRGSTTSPSRR